MGARSWDTITPQDRIAFDQHAQAQARARARVDAAWNCSVLVWEQQGEIDPLTAQLAEMRRPAPAPRVY